MHRYAAALLALCASCGPLHELKLPSEGGASWTEYTSDHFRLQTDMREAEARGVLRSMLREQRARDATREEAQPTRLELWWRASAAW